MINSLGLSRSAPDEYAVIARPPLSVPPEFDLRPPSSAPLDNSEDAASKARSIIKGQEGQSIQSGDLPTMTRAEQNLLVKAGQENADPSIRDKLVADEVRKKEKKKEGVMDKLFGKSDNAEEEPKVTVETEKKEEPKAAPEEAKQPEKSE